MTGIAIGRPYWYITAKGRKIKVLAVGFRKNWVATLGFSDMKRRDLPRCRLEPVQDHEN